MDWLQMEKRWKEIGCVSFRPFLLLLFFRQYGGATIYKAFAFPGGYK